MSQLKGYQLILVSTQVEKNAPAGSKLIITVKESQLFPRLQASLSHENRLLLHFLMSAILFSWTQAVKIGSLSQCIRAKRISNFEFLAGVEIQQENEQSVVAFF